MIRSLKDILVVSDMDNTLLTPEDGVPFVNQVTMRLFCALGGHFTVATGRTMESAGRHLDSMTLSAPRYPVWRGRYLRFRTRYPHPKYTAVQAVGAPGGVRCIGTFPGSGRGDYDRGRRHLRGASQ